MKQEWQKRPVDKVKETKFRKSHNALVSRLLAQRNIPDDLDYFITSEYNSLSHPHTLNGVEEGARLFCDVALRKGKVAVIGDYDCDGVFSSAMIKQLCRIFDLECRVFIPSRFNHGYGLNPKTIKAFKEKHEKDEIDLLFVIDCGSNNEKEIAALKEFGIKHIIVIDHHLIDSPVKSADVFISWLLSDDHIEMCTAGQIFKFIRGIRWLTKKVDPINFLTYAAIGTIADVMPIVGDNRIIVRNGLTSFALNNTLSVGLHSLMQLAYVKNRLTQYEVAFKIAPRINAVGRMDDPHIAYGLLIEDNIDDAKKIAEHIDSYNTERKKKQRDIEIQAEEYAKHNKFENGIFVYDSSWHIGIVGVVASRLVDTFHKPALVVGSNGGIAKGSGRSLGSVHLKNILDRCSHLFESYGGHAAAAGVTLKQNCIGEAAKVFDKACKEYYEENPLIETQILYYDATLKAQAIKPETATYLLENLYPYCYETNFEPLFLIKDLIISGVELKEGENWRLVLFKGSRDGFEIPYEFKYFSFKYGSELDGLKADVYFRFPQRWSTAAWDKFNHFSLTVEDMQIKRD